MPTYDPTSICNRALREVPDRQIADLSEVSLQARECAAAYPDCVAEMLEDHPYSFAVKRQILAAPVTNPRANEWTFAYQVPDDAAFIGKIMPSNDGIANPLGWGDGYPQTPIMGYARPVELFADTTQDFTSRAPGWTRMVEAGLIFTDCPNAIAEYTSTAITENQFTPQFVRALAMLIACRVAPALTKDADRRGKLWPQMEIEKQRAKATDNSRQMDTYGSSVPDWMACR